jgi:hypothetical protein
MPLESAELPHHGRAWTTTRGRESFWILHGVLCYMWDVRPTQAAEAPPHTGGGASMGWKGNPLQMGSESLFGLARSFPPYRGPAVWGLIEAELRPQGQEQTDKGCGAPAWITPSELRKRQR